MKDKSTVNSRATAAKIINSWLRSGKFPDRLIGPETPDRAFVMEMVYGVAKWRRTLEWYISRCAGRKPDEHVMPYLLVGTYQIMILNEVVGYAAVNETVEAAKEVRAKAAGFVNAVLRRILQKREKLMERLEGQALGVRESHPEILIERWRKRYGEEKTVALLKWNNTRPEIIVTPSHRRTSFEDYVASLKTAGIEGATPHPFAPTECIVISHGVKVNDLPGFREGMFSVQDPATLKSVELLDPKPGETVLDACAAPGGKTMLIAEKMNDTGRIVACELHEDRLHTLRMNITRMGLKSVEAVQADATKAEELQKVSGGAAFDRIILDVPCTNTGVLRRRPDARWRFHGRRLSELMTTQRSILTASAGLLKVGGRIVYSTCSLEPEEGRQLVESWLAENPGFELTAQAETFPPETQTDGIYAAALIRKA